MRVLLLADASFAAREHAMLRRLEIGLLDEGVTLARAVPSGADHEPSTGIAANVAFRTGGLKWLAVSPARQILGELSGEPSLRNADSHSPIDVVHAWGCDVWPAALDIARATGASLALEVWSADALGRVAHIEHRTHDLEAAGSMGIWLAPDRSMLHELGRAAKRWPVALSDWGIHPATIARAPETGVRPLSVCVVSSGMDSESCTTCLSGLARAARERDDVIVFLDEAAVASDHAVWRHAEDLGLASIMSVVPSVESRRDPILRSDVLVQPENRGEQRSIVLEAMAAGVAVVAPQDPMVESISGERAMVVGEPTVAAWERAFRTVLGDGSLRRTLCAAAREYALKTRLVHQQIEATLGAYESLTADEPLSFRSDSR